jgi:uncharacterized protein (TIRG00374 family)
VEGFADRAEALTSDRRLLVRTIVWSTANWGFDAASLWVFIRAFGHTEGLSGMLLGYGLAGLLALLPITPGGLGLVEGTLISILVGFGTPHPNAVLGVITWRLAEFWLPIPLGALMYVSLRTGALAPGWRSTGGGDGPTGGMTGPDGESDPVGHQARK